MDLIPEKVLNSADLSIAPYLREVESSTCLLIPASPSPTPLEFNHPLADANINDVSFNGITDKTELNYNGVKLQNDGGDSSSSSGSNSALQDAVSAQLINNISMLDYQTLSKTGDIIVGQNDERKLDGSLSQSGRKLPKFVTWRWNIIRKVLLWIVLSALFACCGVIVSIMVILPKSCNPALPWYQGTVFYEIFTASFEDSNGDGVGDINGIIKRINYIEDLNVAAIRLNSVFRANQYPEQYFKAESLLDLDKHIGTLHDFLNLTSTLHQRNISLILDLPTYPFLSELVEESNENPIAPEIDITSFNRKIIDGNITTSIKYWVSQGVNGFYLKDLEHVCEKSYMASILRKWKKIIGYDRILIVSEQCLAKAQDKTLNTILSHVDMIDVLVNVSNSPADIETQIKNTILNVQFIKPGNSWIHWNVGNVNTKRLASVVNPNKTLDMLLLELALPGTINIFYGDEIGLSGLVDIERDYHEHVYVHNLTPMKWAKPDNNKKSVLPWMSSNDLSSPSFHIVDLVKVMIQLRQTSPTIYLNGVYKEGEMYRNTQVYNPKENILIIERWYPRRNSFILVCNMGSTQITTDLSSMFYGGSVIVSTKQELVGTDIYFKEVTLDPWLVSIIKLVK